MSINLLDPDFWVEQLKNNCPIFDGRIFETIEDDNSALEFYGSPLALVYVASDDSEPNSTVTRVTQLHNASVVVKIAIRKTVNRNDRLNADDSRLIRACRLETITALLGWMPDDCIKPVEHVSGELSAKGDFLLWTDKFTTNNYLRRR